MWRSLIFFFSFTFTVQSAVASLRLVSSGAVTDGVILFLPQQLTTFFVVIVLKSDNFLAIVTHSHFHLLHLPSHRLFSSVQPHKITDFSLGCHFPPDGVAPPPPTPSWWRDWQSAERFVMYRTCAVESVHLNASCHQQSTRFSVPLVTHHKAPAALRHQPLPHLSSSHEWRHRRSVTWPA